MAKKEGVQTFAWEGVNKKGARVKGERSAVNSASVHAELKRLGIQPIKVDKKAASIFSAKSKKIKFLDIVLFARHVATMLAAGLSLVKSLEIIGNSLDNPGMQKLVLSIKTDVEGGTTFYQALTKHPKYFDSLFCNLIRAGEQSGTLDTLLSRVATHLEKIQTLKKKIKKAMFYPIAVMVVAIVVTVALLIFVVPQFAGLFSSYGKKLPLLTQIVMDLSEFVQHRGWVILGAVIIAVFAFRAAKKKYPGFRHALDKMSLKIPIIGPILSKAIVARITRTMATTLSAGIPITEALQLAAEISNNYLYSTALVYVREEVTTGQQLNDAMTTTQVFPKLVTQMVAVGEESGATEAMLNKIANYYEEDVDAAVDSLSSLLEPVIMLVLGTLIGGLVVAMYLPIFKLGSIFT